MIMGLYDDGRGNPQTGDQRRQKEFSLLSIQARYPKKDGDMGKGVKELLAETHQYAGYCQDIISLLRAVLPVKVSSPATSYAVKEKCG